MSLGRGSASRRKKEAAGRERVATRGRGPCHPTVLLPPPVTTSYHKKVTSVSKLEAGHERRRRVRAQEKVQPSRVYRRAASGFDGVVAVGSSGSEAVSTGPLRPARTGCT